jgi:hypothetical protein
MQGLKGLVAKIVVGREVAGGLVFGAVLLCLTGLFLALSKVVDPAVAAGGLGAGILAATFIGVWIIGKK